MTTLVWARGTTLWLFLTAVEVMYRYDGLWVGFLSAFAAMLFAWAWTKKED